MKQKLIFPKKYGSSIEVTSGKLCRVSYELVNEGSDDQQIKFFITGRAPRNKWRSIGEIRIAVSEKSSIKWIEENLWDGNLLVSDNPRLQTVKWGNEFLKAPSFTKVQETISEDVASIKFKLKKIIRADRFNDPDKQDGIQQYDKEKMFLAASEKEHLAVPAAINSRPTLGGKVGVVESNMTPIIAYVYDIVYKSKKPTRRANGVKVKLDYAAKQSMLANSVDKNGVKDIIYSDGISPQGENKKFKIVGTPGSFFTVLTTEREVTQSTDKSMTSTYYKPMRRTDTESIIVNVPDGIQVGGSTKADFTLMDGSAVKMIRGRIPSSGEYVFYQKYNAFPPHVDNDLHKVFGIHIFDGNIGPTSDKDTLRYLDPDLAAINGRDLEEHTNLSSDFPTVKWSRPGGIHNMYPIGKSSDGWYSRDIVQRYDPILTICLSTNQTKLMAVKLNEKPVNWPADEQFNNNHPSCGSYQGKYKDGTGRIYNVITENGVASTAGVPLTTPWIDMVWVVKALTSSPAQAFSSLTQPKFSNTNANESNWSNSVWSPYTMSVGSPAVEQTFPGNGGTVVNMENLLATISTTTWANDTLTVKTRVHVLNWGTQNVTMSLNIDDIVTLS